MRRKKLVISLIIMLVVLFAFSINAFATGEPVQITTITAGNTTNTPASTGSSGTTTNNGTVPIATEGSTGAATANTTQISAGTGNNTIVANNTTTSSTVTNNTVSSSYRNSSSNTNKNGLPYTGSSYGIVFVIIALVVSAVYAYKKVSDYNI